MNTEENSDSLRSFIPSNLLTRPNIGKIIPKSSQKSHVMLFPIKEQKIIKIFVSFSNLKKMENLMTITWLSNHEQVINHDDNAKKHGRHAVITT